MSILLYSFLNFEDYTLLREKIQNQEIFSKKKLGLTKIESEKYLEKKFLDFSQNDISEIKDISLPNVKYLNLRGNKINFLGWNDFPELNFLNLDETNISIYQINNLIVKKLRCLSLSRNQLKKKILNFFTKSENLIGLNLSFNEIDYLDLSSFKNLRFLSLKSNNFLSLDFLETVQDSLIYLNIARNDLKDYSKLRHLVNLKILYVDENQYKFLKNNQYYFSLKISRDNNTNFLYSLDECIHYE